jgi:ParB-like chromosome segregation protein Spo0J
MSKSPKLSIPGGRVVEQVDEIVLDGKKVLVRNLDLPLDDVELDPTNPRVVNTVSISNYGEGEALQKGLRELLWRDPDVHSLYRAVLENKGLVERIIVRRNGVVAEGNCRTVVYRKLRENYPDNPLWHSIPARVLPEDITDRQVAVLLGELHVGGKNKWSPFEKAGHMYALFSQFGITQEEIAKLLRTSKTSVNNNIHAFAAMKEKYLLAFPGTGAVRKFSHFMELYKNPDLREWAKRSGSALDDFVQWVGTGKLPGGADVRGLNDIISNPAALAALHTTGHAAALKVLEKDRPELTSELFKKMIEMTEALEDARLDDIQRVRNDKTGGARAIVRNLKATFDRFVDLCDGLE